MSARRQSSTTSLSKYARASSPDLLNPSLDFCNAFWGPSDGGVDVLFARMRGAGRTMDELRGFWKERAVIEEDYGKRLSRLAKQTLGKDEIGELRNSLDTLRLETDKQATAHLQLAQLVRSDLETPASAFVAKQAQYKKTYQAAIEKAFKAKQTQESYVNKAREKYESDCLRINSYTAQSTLVQGKDLEKINLKLDRAKQTVTANERDFANFARALQDTVAKWEKDWKGFCDGCQDIEEDRIEFMKDNVWAYANAVSTVCVADDESCEHIRLALEQLEPERDMENFVRDYSTGNQIPEPPQFVNHTNPNANPPARPAIRHAHYPRSSQRPMSMAAAMRPPPPEEEPSGPGSAGIGAGMGRGAEALNRSSTHRESLARSNTQRESLARSNTHRESVARSNTQSRPRADSRGPVNGAGSAVHNSASAPAPVVAPQPSFTSSSQSSQAGPASFRPRQDPQAEPINPAHKTMIQVGGNAYEVDPDRDPQVSRSGPGPSSAGPSGSAAGNKVGDEADPLARQMADLRNVASTVRRDSASASKPQARPVVTRGDPSQAGPSSSRPSSALFPPSGSASASQPIKNDYRKSAEIVVGSYSTSASRPSSPANPPTASFMQPPLQTSSSNLPVEDVVAAYEQSFPGEHKPRSRSNSRAGSASQDQNRNSMIERPVSREGHAGIGAHGRTPSPQPVSRSVSPAPPGNRNSIVNPGSSGQPRRSPPVQRASSPGNLGITLDATGRVSHDEMAERYAQQQFQQQQQQQNQQQHQEQYVPQQSQYPPQRRPSYNATMAAPPPVAAPPPPHPYAVPPPGSMYTPQNAQQPQYAPPPHHAQTSLQQPPQSTNVYNPHAPQYQPPPPAPQAHPGYQPAPQNSYHGHVNGNSGLQRGPSTPGYYSSTTSLSSPQSGHPHNQSYHSQAGSAGGFRAPSPVVARTPSPAPPPQSSAPPTGQYWEDGRPVLFYVKALYDYEASIEEEFDFQAGDIIAVISTPEDGWWTGVLLDDTRRVPGRTVFPSNFVCLF